MTLRALAILSGLYDLALGAAMLTGAKEVARLAGAPIPLPLVHAQLNGLFALTLGLGYLWCAGDVPSRRGYLWIAGVLARGLGAALLVWDHYTVGSPRSFLLFAATNGALALLTMVLLFSRNK